MVVGLAGTSFRVRLYNLIAQNRIRPCRLNNDQSAICRTGRHFSSSAGDGDDKKTQDDDDKSAKSTTPESSSTATGRKSRSPPIQRGDPAMAKSKLNDLLQSIVKDQEQRAKSDDQKPIEKQIQFNLAKKETPRPTPEALLAAEEEKETTKQIGKEMLTAVKKVAKSMPGDQQAVESELVKKLKSHASTKVNLSELFEGMTVDKQKPRPDQQQQQQQQRGREDFRPPGGGGDYDSSRAYRVRQDMGDRGDRRRQPQSQSAGSDDRRFNRGRSAEEVAELTYRPIDIFGGKPLGIFTKAKPSERTVPISYLKTWEALRQRDLRLATTHPPANGFEEMILWTEQGKLWHFPIDNEQGLDMEAKVSFTDHIFLEPHIEGWCPKKGPIRHFMELVCIGLSKNPYLTVHEKKDQIEWYHQYFLNKASIIKEVGAGEIKQ